MSDPIVSNGYASNNPDIPVRCSTTTANKQVQHYRQDPATTATTVSYSVTAGNNVIVLPSNANRLSASIYNTSATTGYIRFGEPANGVTYKLPLRPNSYFELPQPIFTGDVYVFSPSGTTTILAAEEIGGY